MTTIQAPADNANTVRYRTTDATVTTVHTETTTKYASATYEVEATAMNTAGTTQATFVRRASFRWAAGTIAKIGETYDVFTRRDSGALSGGWDVGILASGNNAVVQIVGQAATTINWLVKTKVLANISKNDSGTSTATSATTLTDSGKSWATNEWAGGYVSSGLHMRIVSNTGTVLTGTAWTGGDSGTADAAVTTTDTTLTDTREAWAGNEWDNMVVTCNGKTMVITTNNGTTLTGASWSGGGNPGNGNAWTIGYPTTRTYTLDTEPQA